MSTTRRQSGRLAKQTVSQPKIKAKAGSGKYKLEEEESCEESEEEESEGESDASDYGKRPVKRQKLQTRKSSTTLRKRKSMINKTCYLTAIVLDVLLEIFVQLDPKDLISLARTNHAFRGHLLSKASNNVWKKSRENADGPDCPPDLSEQRWAHLLYGEAKCQSCGAKNVQRVDFGLRRRACTRCLQANLVVTSSFRRHFPDLEDTILDLIPYTNIGGFAHGHASRSNFYWKPDIEKMVQILAVHERDVNMRVIGARKKLKDFTEERIALVATVVDHAAICKDWSRQLAICRENEQELKCDQRYNAIKERFMKLGYTETDISCIVHQGSVRQPSQLTDRIWNNIYPELETLIKARRDKRLKAERDDLIAARTRLAKNIYIGYKKTLLPAQWRLLPGLYEVLQLPAFDAVLNAADDVNVEMAHFKEGRDALPAFVVSWAANRKMDLIRLINKGRTSGLDPSDSQDGPTSAIEVSSTQSLDLATTVFGCAQSHHCHATRYDYSIYQNGRSTNSIETILDFSKRGSDAAASLVTLAGLNDQQATCAEMDRLDLRFVCIACPGRNAPDNKQIYSTFSWRSAVSHFVTGRHSAPLWQKLNSVDAQKVKSDEGPDSTLSWSCNHCPQFLDDCRTFTDVTDHVKTIHAIANPKVPADLFRHLDIPRSPVTFTVPAPQYHCNRCPALVNRRVFKLDGVQSHLKAKHKVLNPVESEDWERAAQS
ncbi:hypothetical protein FB451DRAFT_59049 [Mycena latifolia]|nr:hypothetical protein FB451DRAFT_59049 [Mycena latifolia]